jgi:hypothetical protein
VASIPEWSPETTIRRRLWSLAKFNRANIKTAVSVRQLIDNLVTAHVKNWYDDKPPLNSDGVRIVDWAPLLKNVCRLHPKIWSAEPIEAPASEIQRRRGPMKGEVNRYEEADRALFPEMKRLMVNPQYGSVRAAALHLAAEGKIAGPSTVTETAKADRLARRYRAANKSR